MPKSSNDLTMRQLQMIADALRSADLTATARKHGVTQPAITYHLKNFERYVGVTLLARRGNNYVVTESGQLIIELQDKIESIISNVISNQGKKKKIKILVPTEFARFNHVIRDSLEDNSIKIFFEDWGGILNHVNKMEYDFCIFPSFHRSDEADLVLEHHLKWYSSAVQSHQDKSGKLIFPSKVSPLLDSYLHSTLTSLRDSVYCETQDFFLTRHLMDGQNLTAMLPELLRNEYLLTEVTEKHGIQLPSAVKFYYNVQIRNGDLHQKIEHLCDQIIIGKKLDKVKIPPLLDAG